MAQSFPLRLSAPLQILLDCDQKRDFNGREEEKRYSKETSKEFNTSIIRYQEGKNALRKQNKGTISEYPDWAAVDDMLIFEFYQDYVEKFLHVMPCSETLSRMDKDPEDSNFLLKLSVAFGLLL